MCIWTCVTATSVVKFFVFIVDAWNVTSGQSSFPSGRDVAKMLANRIQTLSEEKFAELSVQLRNLPNPDSFKKVKAK